MRVVVLFSLLVFTLTSMSSTGSSREEALAQARKGVEAEREAAIPRCEALLESHAVSRMPDRCLTPVEQYRNDLAFEAIPSRYFLPDSTSRVLQREAETACAVLSLQAGARCTEALVGMAVQGMASVSTFGAPQGLGRNKTNPIYNSDLMREEVGKAMQVAARACLAMHEAAGGDRRLACALSELTSSPTFSGRFRKGIPSQDAKAT